MENFRRKIKISLACFCAFILWTFLLSSVDVRSIAPDGSKVGLASLNRYVHNLTGVHWSLYRLTDLLSLIPLFLCVSFGVLGALQWFSRKAISQVDSSLIILGGFYILLAAIYLLFEKIAVNVRPVWIDGVAEPSYPSSTTLLVICVISTADLQLKSRIQNHSLSKSLSIICNLFMAFMIIGRLLSGVHWISDIIGSILLSKGLIALYDSLCILFQNKQI